MKRKLILPVLILWLASMSCSLFTRDKATQAPTVQPTVAMPVEPTSPPEVKVEPTATEEVKPPEPTATEEVKVEPTETEVVIEATPTEEPPSSFEYTFDRNTQDWSDPLFVTTQASGNPRTKITIENGIMRYAINDKETYVYRFLAFGVQGDVTIEVDYQNKGSTNTGIALVCKASEDLTSWYEVRFTAMDGNVNYYLYDKARRDEGKNPYLLLGKTHVASKDAGPTKPNKLKVTCSDSEISIDVNKGKVTASQELETQLDGTIVGIGGMSFDVVPVTMDIDTVVVGPTE